MYQNRTTSTLSKAKAIRLFQISNFYTTSIKTHPDGIDKKGSCKTQDIFLKIKIIKLFKLCITI